ncbi:MAG: glycosyltransferase [Chloroflexota bacterium]|nr:glycosyltransferase [Chloroflexota bacterium]
MSRQDVPHADLQPPLAGEGNPEPIVSVVVPTYNRSQSMQRLLHVLGAQTLPVDRFEVVVVDDGSTDGTPEVLRRSAAALPYRLRVFEQQHGGPALARNLGVAQARGRLIVFVDDDVVPAADLLATHVATHESEPDAVVIGPMSPPYDMPRPAWIRWEEKQLLAQYESMIAGLWACTARQFYTGNASLPRDRFLRAGGFDAHFKRAEDVELAYRLHNAGARFIFNHRAVVLHYAARSFEAWCQTPYQYGRYDVVMERDKGHESLQQATREYHYRHPLSRLLTRFCVGRRVPLALTVLALRLVTLVADWVGARWVTSISLSAIFSLRYWQGVCDELGGPGPVWRLVAAARR